jgi:hypothetical protein
MIELFDSPRSCRSDSLPGAVPRVMRRALAEGYSVAVDAVSAGDWYEHVGGFSDANLYQLWQQAPDRHGGRPVSRLLLKHREQIVAVAEVRLFTVPFVERGIAYVRWGPLWKRRGDGESLDALRQALRALYNEYVVRRGLVLRIAPRLMIEGGADYASIASEEGFSGLTDRNPERTLLLPLAGDLAELRKKLAQKWRNSLNKAEKSALSVTGGTGLDLFDDFTLVYKEMLRRKGFAPTADIYRHRRLQAVLPDHMKMAVLLARHEGRLCAGVIYSALGDTALYLFGATNEIGMRTSASYLLQWEVLRRLKDQGIRAYDLHGINPDTNPGTYHFKKGLAGRDGTAVTFVSHLQAFDSSFANHLLVRLDRMRQRLRTWRSTVAAGERRGARRVTPSDSAEGER